MEQKPVTDALEIEWFDGDITDEFIARIRAAAQPILDGDEWIVIDGPGW